MNRTQLHQTLLKLIMSIAIRVQLYEIVATLLKLLYDKFNNITDFIYIELAQTA